MEAKRLKNLLEGVEVIELKGEEDVVVANIAIDSRLVQKGYAFGAFRGSVSDGHDFIDKAIGQGASVIICDVLPEEIMEGITYVRTLDTRDAIGKIGAAYYDHPSKHITCVGITGTNGKTSIATLLYNLFKDLGYSVGLISTIEILVNDKKWETQLTTPDVITLHRVMASMVEAGCEYVFMEVSSHAADQNRIAGLNFKCGVFTNLTHDHLDYHGSFKAYIEAKQSFFSGLSQDAYAVINIDDKHGGVMVEKSKAQVRKYSSRQLTDYKVRLISDGKLGMMLEINGKSFMTRLSGSYNAMNLTAVYAVADIFLNIEEEHLAEKISALRGAIGRLELVWQHPRVIVDYAHTPDALANVLRTLKSSLDGGRLITVVGCGGDRDKGKRPVMALEAYRQSDLVILTSDNPRSEDPQTIIDDMKTGLAGKELRRVLDIADRRSAIKTALALSDESDTVLIAGKGHEEYQEVKGVRHFFSDQQIVKDILSNDI